MSLMRRSIERPLDRWKTGSLGRLRLLDCLVLALLMMLLVLLLLLLNWWLIVIAKRSAPLQCRPLCRLW